MEAGDVFKFGGLIAFFALVCVIVVIAWPYITDLFTEGGPERMVERLQEAGPAGVFVLLGMQFLQIVVAVIPGEVVQLAAGLMYGPWLGALIILVGCVCSSALIYQLVHKLGAPFVQNMVSTEHLDKFRTFEESGKLDIIVFILFLIPGMPKDVFTYLVPLTDMELKRFVLLSNVARIPPMALLKAISSDRLSSWPSSQSSLLWASFSVTASWTLLEKGSNHERGTLLARDLWQSGVSTAELWRS